MLLSISSSNVTLSKISTIENTSTTKILASSTTKAAVRNIKNIVVFIEFSDSDKNVIHHLDDEESVKNANIIYNSDTLFDMDSVKGIIQVPSFKKYFERELWKNVNYNRDFSKS